MTATKKQESPRFGPFEEEMSTEKQEFGLFENYLETLHNLQGEIIDEME